MNETRDDLREALARAIFERGRRQGGIDPETWEVAGDEMQAWLLGHADAMIAGPFAPILAQVSALQAEVEEARQDAREAGHNGGHLLHQLDQAKVEIRRLSAEVECLQKVEGERDAALKAAAILLPFVDMAAGEGLEWSEQECGSPRMDAADLCIQAAEALGFDLGDDQYTALLKQGEDAIRAGIPLTETKEGSDAR